MFVKWFPQSLRQFSIVDDLGFREIINQVQAMKDEFKVLSTASISRKAPFFLVRKEIY